MQLLIQLLMDTSNREAGDPHGARVQLHATRPGSFHTNARPNWDGVAQSRRTPMHAQEREHHVKTRTRPINNQFIPRKPGMKFGAWVEHNLSAGDSGEGVRS